MFSRERERFAKHGKWQKSNIRILGSKSSPNMRAVHQLFARVVFSSAGMSKKFDIFVNVFSIPQTIGDASEALCMFGELLEPKIWMLNFAVFSTFVSFACPVKTQFKPHKCHKITMSNYISQKWPSWFWRDGFTWWSKRCISLNNGVPQPDCQLNPVSHLKYGKMLQCNFPNVMIS